MRFEITFDFSSFIEIKDQFDLFVIDLSYSLYLEISNIFLFQLGLHWRHQKAETLKARIEAWKIQLLQCMKH